jgi:hypothetical protein
VQWAGSTPFVLQITNLTLWGLGPPLAIAAWLGCLMAAVQLLRAPRRHHLHLLLLVWIAVNLIYWGPQFAKPMRYLLPIYPQLALCAALLLVGAWRLARDEAPIRFAHRIVPARVRQGAVAALTLVVVGWTIGYAVAFTAIYTRPTTRVAASEWIYDHIPPRSAIGREHWDDALPLPRGGRQLTASYQDVELPVFTEDSTAKFYALLQKLEALDVIVLASNRGYGSIPRMPQRYPMTIRYYDALFSGELGFDRVAVFTSRPALAGIELNDDDAEESFTVYDHPRVDIFSKGPRYSSDRARAILEMARGNRPR